MKNLVRTSGIPVLAYSTSHADASSCLLLIKYSEAYKQATFLLQTSIPIKGLDDKQTFILQYNADNLVTSDTSLRAVTILLPQTSQNNIARRDDPEMYTLSLSIKEVCPVWCTPSSGLVFPRVGFYSVFNQLAALARATEIHILFDYKWVHHENRGLLRQLIHRSQELTGVPVNEYSTIYRLTDWSVFGPLEAAGEVEDSPPRYTHTSHKRCRDVVSSSPPKSPDVKRICLSPTTSVTEKDTTAKPSPISPHSTIAPALVPQEAINKAVETLLPGMLESTLPALLSTLSTLTSLPTSSPSTSLSPQSSSPLFPVALSPLGTLSMTQLVAHVQGHLDGIRWGREVLRRERSRFEETRYGEQKNQRAKAASAPL